MRAYRELRSRMSSSSSWSPRAVARALTSCGTDQESADRPAEPGKARGGRETGGDTREGRGRRAGWDGGSIKQGALAPKLMPLRSGPARWAHLQPRLRRSRRRRRHRRRLGRRIYCRPSPWRLPTRPQSMGPYQCRGPERGLLVVRHVGHAPWPRQARLP